MRQDVISLYDQYVHGGISRREFFDRLTQTVGGTAAAFALLPTLEYDYGQAPLVTADDKSLEIGRASYDTAGTKMSGYLAREKGGKKRPAKARERLPSGEFDLVQIHDVDGLQLEVGVLPGLTIDFSRVLPPLPKVVRESPRKYL